MSDCNKQKVIETCKDLCIKSPGKACSDIIFGKKEGIVLTLPSCPHVGESHLVVADGGDITLSGGKNPLQCDTTGDGLFIEDGTAVEVLWAPSKEWIVEAKTATCLDSAFLTQNEWFIDPINGNDNNSGKSAALALKHFSEWQNRVGIFTTLAPSIITTTSTAISGQVTINILNDLPITDPITFRNFMKSGTTARIQGQKKVLATGTFSAVGTRDRALNQPWTVTKGSGAANYWTQFQGKMLYDTTTKTHGVICRDLNGVPVIGGARKAQISNWIDSIPASGATQYPDIDGFIQSTDQAANPGTSLPVAGNSYQVVDYTKVYFGAMVVGTDNSNQTPMFFGGLLLFQFHVLGLSSTFPQAIAGANTITSVADTIFETPVNLVEAVNALASNCSFQVTVRILSGELQELGGAHLPYIPMGGDYPGGIRCETGAKWTAALDITFIGDGAGNFADVQMLGTCFCGPLSFWNSLHSIFPIQGGSINFEGGAPFSGEIGYVPLWGTGNVSKIACFPQSNFDLDQFNFDAPCPLPSIEMNAGPGGTVMRYWQSDNNDQANAWQRGTGTFTPPIPITWANFEVDAPAGFRTNHDVVPGPGGSDFQYANAADPGDLITTVRSAFRQNS